MKIHVVHTIHAFTATTGGTATCTYDLLHALNAQGKIQAEALVTAQQKQMGNGESWIRVMPNDEKTSFAIFLNLSLLIMNYPIPSRRVRGSFS